MNLNVMIKPIRIKRHAIFAIVFVCVSVQAYAQTNQYLNQLGKSFHVNDIKNWSKKNDGIDMTSSADTRWYGVALPKFGLVYHHDFNKVNGATVVKEIAFGKASVVKKLYSGVKGIERVTDSKANIPFGLKLGMTKKEIEVKAGKMSSSKVADFDGITRTFVSNLPGYRFLDLDFWFENDLLVYFKISTTNSFFYRHRIEESDHPMRMDFAEAMAQKSISRKKLHFARINESLQLLFKNQSQPVEERQTNDVIQGSLRYRQGPDSVFYQPNRGYRVVWCIANVVDKESFFDEFMHILKISLEKDYRKGGFSKSLVAPYRSYKENTFDYYFHHVEDRSSVRTRNRHMLFHTYLLKNTNEVVLDIYDPNENGLPRFEQTYLGICTPADPDLALSEEEYLKKIGVDLPSLKVKFSKHPGNALFQLIGEREGSELHGNVNFSGLEIGTEWDEKISETWVDEVLVRMDNLSKSAQDFKGDIPLGLTRKMKMSQIQNVIPDFSFRKTHLKENWQRMYASEGIGNLTLYYNLFFSRGKLYWVGLSVSNYHSRLWGILKREVFPNLN